MSRLKMGFGISAVLFISTVEECRFLEYNGPVSMVGDYYTSTTQ